MSNVVYLPMCQDEVDESYSYQKEDWPWIWAIRNLDWRLGMSSSEEIMTTMKRQKGKLPVPILYHIWIGNQLCANDVNRLRDLGITHVLNMAGGTIAQPPIDEYQEQQIQYLELEGHDVESFPLLQRHYKKAKDFISQAAAQKGICLVYCEGGLNRSCLIVAAVVMVETQWNVLKTVQLIRRQRGDYALMNEGFQEQLVAFARRRGLLGPRPGTQECIITEVPPPESKRQAFWEETEEG